MSFFFSDVFLIAEVLSFVKVQFNNIFFPFIPCDFGVVVKKSLLNSRSQDCLLPLFLEVS